MIESCLGHATLGLAGIQDLGKHVGKGTAAWATCKRLSIHGGDVGLPAVHIIGQQIACKAEDAGRLQVQACAVLAASGTVRVNEAALSLTLIQETAHGPYRC